MHSGIGVLELFHEHTDLAGITRSESTVLMGSAAELGL